MWLDKSFHSLTSSQPQEVSTERASDICFCYLFIRIVCLVKNVEDNLAYGHVHYDRK